METPIKNKQQRRKLLKSAALGGGLLGASGLETKWIKPVVDSVMLPAHASTTGDVGILPGDVGSRYSFMDQIPTFYGNALGLKMPLVMATPPNIEATLTNRLIEMLMPSAYAEKSAPIRLEFFLEITAEGVYRFVVLLLRSDNEFQLVYYSNSAIVLGDNNVTIQLCVEDGGPTTDIVITVLSVTSTSASILINGNEAYELLYDQNAVAPQRGACNLPN